MLIKKLLISSLCFSLLGSVYGAESYKELSHQYNVVFQQFLREKIVKLPKRATVEVFLKDGTSVKGTFENFSKYDDSIWIMPLGKRGLFSDEAYDVRELQDVSIIVLRQI